MIKVFLFGGGEILKRLIILLNNDDKYLIIGLHPREADGVSTKELSEQFNIDLYPSLNINEDEYLKIVRDTNTDIIISCNEKQIFKQPLIDSAKIASVNLHGGILPLQRGGGSVYSAFINYQDVGVSVHYLTEEIDAGAIIKQKSRPILDTENALNIVSWFNDIAPSLYYESLNEIINGNVNIIDQKNFKYTYIPAKPEYDEMIQWNDNSSLIHNKIRARQGPIYNYTYFNDKKIFILESQLVNEEIANFIGPNGQVIHRDSRGVIVKCNDNAILLTKIKFENNEEYIPNFPISTMLGINLYKKYFELEEKINNINKEKIFYRKFMRINSNIILRQLTQKDSTDIYHYSSDKKFTEFLSFKTGGSKEDVIQFIKFINIEIEEKSRFYWGIEVNKQIIGTIGYLNINIDNKEAELGFGISPEFWGKGIVNQCLSYLVHMAFTQLNFERLVIGTVTGNDRTSAFTIKEGFEFDYSSEKHTYFCMTKERYEKTYCY